MRIAWSADHGIADLATPPNRFAGGPWTVTLDPEAPLPDLSLRELLASNGTGLADEDGEQSDWIEVHNRGSSVVNLAGFSLSDEPDDPGKWTFPSVALPAGGYLVVFASGKDRRPPGGQLHSSFQLNAAGEYLGLFDGESPRNALAELAPAYPPQRPDHSYGEDAAGRPAYFETPTPGQPNGAGSAFPGFASEPLFSVPRGLYRGPVTVHLASPTPGASIRYTLDGREPTETVGTQFAGPLTLAPAAGRAVFTLRAAAFKEGLLPSRVATHTYVFPDLVPGQGKAPAEFPATWGNSSTTPADYEMDPLVVQDPAYSSLAVEGLSTIPSVSIVMSVDDLFGRTRGIYSNAASQGVAWERPASAELIRPDATREFQIDCGVRIQGGSSTGGWKSLKLSLRLLFKEDYGHSKLGDPIYGSARAREFDSLVLDAGLNLTYNHPSHDQRVRSQYVRDQFVSDIQNAAGGLAPEGMLVHLYLNGLYWGLYDLHERPDASFAAAYLGGDKAEYDVLRHTGSEIVDGNRLAWSAMMGSARGPISTIPQYEALQAHLDVPAFADYMLVNLFAGNDDWPHHNWYATRRRAPGGLFRFHSWDAEHVLKDVGINQTGVSNLDSPGELLSRLRTNPEFRLLFADRAQRMLAPGGILHVDAASPAWDPDHPEAEQPRRHLPEPHP